MNDRVYVMDNSMCSSYSLLLFGGDISADLERNILSMENGFVRFKAPARIAALIKAIRKHLDALLKKKIQHPELTLKNSPIIHAILRLLTTNGF
jgi:ATP-dependent RNA helicase DHX57